MTHLNDILKDPVRSEAYWEGYRAYMFSTQAECPYEIGPLWEAWNEGFDQAESELSKENLLNQESENET